MFLTDSFVISTVQKNPRPLNELGEFVFYRTYSRWLDSEGRREYWHETCRRAVEYNITLVYKHLIKIGYTPNIGELRKEAEELFEAMYSTKQFLAGRTLWVGGANSGVVEKYPSSNFNCSFSNIDSWDKLCDLFYLLLVGTGVGFKCTQAMAKKLPKVRLNVTCVHGEYNPVPKEYRLENTAFNILNNGYVKIYIGDSKEGWVEALKYYLNVLTQKEYENIHTIKFSYNSIRPKGEPLKTFGGTASGHESLKDMFTNINRVLKGKIDPYLAPIKTDEKGYGKLRPIHVLDIGNLIGYNVIVGGTRRTSEMFLMDNNDWECILAKYGINGFHTEDQLKHHLKVGELLGENKPDWFDSLTLGKIRGNGNLDHRRMSNNSIAFEEKPDKKFLHLLFELMQLEGEPSFINLEEARRRHPQAQGVNPCGEIILDSNGLCNLTTVNLTKYFNKNGAFNLPEVIEAQIRSVRAALRMTLVDIELSDFDKIQKRDRLLGCSLTGIQDTLCRLNWSRPQENRFLTTLNKISQDAAEEYAKELRIPTPLLVTCIKPEGSLSQLAGGVSPGIHYSHSPFYIRRIRINSHDPLIQVAIKLGWIVNPEVGTPGETYEEKMNNANVLVIDFPVASGSIKTKYDISSKDQLDTYFQFMQCYADHNVSTTISVRENEWAGVEKTIWNNWNSFVGVSFISLDDHTYYLAPYEAITEKQYKKLKAKMKLFDVSLLQEIENSYTDTDILDSECASGACPIR